MAAGDREHWNERYRARQYDRSPDAWLVGHRRLLAPRRAGARALDLACGAGRHATWLAELGYAVDAWDVSEEGLALLSRELERPRAAALTVPLSVSPRQVDLDTVTLPSEAYDLVLDAFFLDRRLLPQLPTALRPAGLVVVRTLMRRDAADDRNPAFLLAPGELRTVFEGLEILATDEDPGQGVAGIIARTPAPRG